MKKLIQTLVFLSCFLGGFAFAGTAGDVATDPDTIDAIGAALTEIVNAAASGQWSLSAVLLVVLLVAGARKYGPKKWAWLRGDIGGTALVVFTTFGLALAGAIKGGDSPSWGMLWGAFKLAAFSAGGYTLIRRLGRLLLGKLPLPSWAKRGLTALLWIFKAPAEDAIPKAEAAGRAAVEANPAEGLGKPDELP